MLMLLLPVHLKVRKDSTELFFGLPNLEMQFTDDAPAAMNRKPVANIGLVNDRTHCFLVLVRIKILKYLEDFAHTKQLMSILEQPRLVRREVRR
jgi:hypothetical protein